MASLLIVEDDRAICELMVRTLTVNGHKCPAACIGGETFRSEERRVGKEC